MLTLPRLTCSWLFLRRTRLGVKGAFSDWLAEFLASLSTALACRLFLPLIHLKSMRMPYCCVVRRESSFQSSAFLTGVPSAVVQSACGQDDLALFRFSTTYCESV